MATGFPIIFGGGVSRWTPAQIQPSLWFDASDANTLTLNGSNVSQWNDKSGNGRNVAQSTAASQPTYQSSGLNSRPTISADGNDILQGTITINELGNSLSVFCVTIMNSTSLANARLISYQASGDANDYSTATSFSLSRNSTLAQYLQFRNLASVSNIATTYGQASIIGMIYNGTNGLLYEDGVASTAGASTGNFGKTATIRLLGISATDAAWNGKLSEMVMVSSALSTADRQRLEGYLAWKWGGV